MKKSLEPESTEQEPAASRYGSYSASLLNLIACFNFSQIEGGNLTVENVQLYTVI
jgi:hypothetical protein